MAQPSTQPPSGQPIGVQQPAILPSSNSQQAGPSLAGPQRKAAILSMLILGVMITSGVLGITLGVLGKFLPSYILFGFSALLFILLIILGYIGKWFRWVGVGPSEFEKESSLEETYKPPKSKTAVNTPGIIETKLIKTSKHQPGKTLWDWLQLLGVLAIPLVVVGATILFSMQQADLAQQQHKAEQLIASDQQRETTLQIYLDRISDLLFNQHLDKSQPGDKVRNAAQARTLTALRQLDSKRKGLLLQFLYKAGLISRVNTIINLESADLSDADLQGLDLHGVNLHKANLQGANLSGALLYDAILTDVTSSNANMSGINLNGALLMGAHLSGANLSRDNLLKKATLENANLFGAELNGANLSGADLSGANLLYTQLIPQHTAIGDKRADLSSADLQEASLGGANLSGANLKNANLNGADLTGANLTKADWTGAGGIQKQLAKARAIKWEVIEAGNILLIAYNAGTTLPQYGALDLDNSALRLGWYDPSSPQSGWGTSLILLPALWSQTSCSQSKGYCQGAPVSVSYQIASGQYTLITADIPIGQVADQNLILSIQGTIAGLQVTSQVNLSPPAPKKPISAYITTQVKGNVVLDTNQPSGSFEPIVLNSMHISSTQWDSQRAYAEAQFFDLPFPGDTWIIQPPAITPHQKFGLLGGTSSWKTNAPSVEVQLEQPLAMPVTGWVTKSSNPDEDNVGFWCASNKVLPSWSYTLRVF
jgi:uncharacterized protein YjbI with pentapeptide repeats